MKLASALLTIVLAGAPLAANAAACAHPAYQRANAIAAFAQTGEFAYDCTQSVTLFQRGGTELDPLTPPEVTIENRAAHPGLCMLAGAGISLAEFGLLRCDSPWWFGLSLGAEGYNIKLNNDVLHGRARNSLFATHPAVAVRFAF